MTFDSGFLAEILSVNVSGLSRAAIDTTHATSPSGWMTFLASDLKDPGELSIEIAHDASEVPPINSAAETVTLTHPIEAGGNTAGTWAASGFMTSYEPTIPIDDRMTANVTIKWTGPITFTAAT